MYDLTFPDESIVQFPTLAHALAWLSRRQEWNGQLLATFAEQMELWHHCESFELGRHGDGLGIKLGSGPASAQSIITTMLDEVMPFAVSLDGTPKEAYEMTREDWRAVMAVGGVAHGDIFYLTEEQQKQDCVCSDGLVRHVKAFTDRLLQERLGYEHGGRQFSRHFYVREDHEFRVAIALAEGKQVSEQVLSPYRQAPSGAREWAPIFLAWIISVLDAVPQIRERLNESLAIGLHEVLTHPHSQVQITPENAEQLFGLAETLGVMSVEV